MGCVSVSFIESGDTHQSYVNPAVLIGEQKYYTIFQGKTWEHILHNTM